MTRTTKTKTPKTAPRHTSADTPGMEIIKYFPRLKPEMQVAIAGLVRGLAVGAEPFKPGGAR